MSRILAPVVVYDVFSYHSLIFFFFRTLSVLRKVVRNIGGAHNSHVSQHFEHLRTKKWNNRSCNANHDDWKQRNWRTFFIISIEIELRNANGIFFIPHTIRTHFSIFLFPFHAQLAFSPQPDTYSCFKRIFIRGKKWEKPAKH